MRRHIQLDGAFNLRDVGGYRAWGGQAVRWRTLLRSDSLHRLEGDDVTILEALAVRSVVDLRTPTERIDFRAMERLNGPPSIHHLPLLQQTWAEARAGIDSAPLIEEPAAFLSRRYAEMLEEGAPSIAALLELLAREDAYPVLVHCSAGKDRTGVVSAVVLGLLGVSDELIIRDYAASDRSMRHLERWIRESDPVATDVIDRCPALVAAPPNAMRLLIRRVRAEYGTFEGYAVAVGVELPVVETIRRNLLE